MKKITVYSDGYGAGTYLIDEDGNRLEGVFRATIELEANQASELHISMYTPNVTSEAYLKSVSWTCKGCGGDVSHDCSDTPQTLGGDPA